MRATLNRWEPFRGAATLQEQVNRLFGNVLEHSGEESNLTSWAPAVDIYETAHELVVNFAGQWLELRTFGLFRHLLDLFLHVFG